MKKVLISLILIGTTLSLQAQRVLTMDSCRALALRNNKQLNVAKLKADVATNLRKAARTKYLPKVDAIGTYQHVSEEVSLLKSEQKDLLSNLGTTATNSMSGSATELFTGLVQQGVITPEIAQQMAGVLNKVSTPLATAGDQIGQNIRDAFRTDTRNIWAGTVMLRQPIYLGGAITAANRMADINEKMVANDIDLRTQNTLYEIEQTYWLVVSLRQKQKLANSYYELINKLDKDVHKMIGEGVATRADGLKVDVKVNEAEMQLTQVENGLSLSKMLLCQLCGIPMNDEIILADEDAANIQTTSLTQFSSPDVTLMSRPEVRMLQNTVDLSKQATKLVRAAYLPQVALTAGYLITNPNPYNGFEKEFGGAWNIGVLVRVPVWNWFEGRYKVNAVKATTSIAQMELSDIREKINLQISQSQFKVTEAQKRLAMALKNIQSAEENLRTANIGFREGVIDATDVMAAQTAWQSAQTQKIDAEIDVKLTEVSLSKALGQLTLHQ